LTTIYPLLLGPYDILTLVEIYTPTNLRKPPYSIPDSFQP
jgi:hypothetical protein